MDEEMTTMEKNNTRELVDQPKSKDIISLKWYIKASIKKMTTFKST